MDHNRNKGRNKIKKHRVATFIKVVLFGIALGAAGFVLLVAVNLFKLGDLEQFEPERILGAAQTLMIYDDSDAEIMRIHSAEDRVPVALEDIPEKVRYAFISAEDARFYDHFGIDLIRIAAAAWEDLKAGSYVQGASTISQQLIKLSHLTADKTMSRKLEEAILAYQMEQRYSKDEILEMYLNYVYLGRGYYGIEAASLGYFGIHASELSLSQAATLAAALKSTANYSPHLNPEASLKRRNLVLSLMCEYGYVSEAERDRAISEPLTIIPKKTVSRGYYIDAVLDDAERILSVSADELLTGGYRIYTAMDVELQAYCEELFSRDDLFPTEDCEAALVIQRNGTGLVAALVGGRSEAAARGFNRATDIRRQPGSLIKPIIAYAPALENGGYTAATMLLDEQTVFADYAPRNFSNKYYGWVTMREAVKRSLNIPAVKVLNEIGVEGGKRFARTLGIEFDAEDTSLTLALGGFAYGVSPWQMAGAYAAFGSGGVYSTPSVIRRITDAKGNVLYEYQPETLRIMSEGNAYVLTSMLKSAIEEGTGARLGKSGIPLAGKTGTVGEEEGNRDAWMAAYNPEWSACVWMGYDTSADGSALPSDATGGKYPAYILGELYAHLYPDANAPDFTKPQDIVEIELDAHTLSSEHRVVLANAFTPSSSRAKEVFVNGSEPTEVTEYWSIPLPARGFTVKLNAAGTPEIGFRARQGFVVYKLYRKSAATEAVCINEWKGTTSQVTYEDTSVKPGETYTYHLVPEHEELVISGKRVRGPSSDSISVFVPLREIMIEDIELPDN